MRKWNAQEDALLVRFVMDQIEGPNKKVANWGAIGAQLDKRTGKQCRERWHNQLDPTIRKDPWTPEEEDTLVKVGWGGVGGGCGRRREKGGGGGLEAGRAAGGPD